MTANQGPQMQTAAKQTVQFTPGPWVVFMGSRVMTEGGKDIVQTHGLGRHAPDTEEAKANARLIAAAPDLYEALRNLLTGYDVGGIVAADPLFDIKLAGSFERARAALSKIEG